MKGGMYVVCVHHAVGLVNTKFKDKENKQKKKSLPLQSYLNYFSTFLTITGFLYSHTAGSLMFFL